MLSLPLQWHIRCSQMPSASPAPAPHSGHNSCANKAPKGILFHSPKLQVATRNCNSIEHGHGVKELKCLCSLLVCMPTQGTSSYCTIVVRQVVCSLAPYMKVGQAVSITHVPGVCVCVVCEGGTCELLLNHTTGKASPYTSPHQNRLQDQSPKLTEKPYASKLPTRALLN